MSVSPYTPPIITRFVPTEPLWHVTVAVGDGPGVGDGLDSTGVAIGLGLGLGLLAAGDGERAKWEPLKAPRPPALTNKSKEVRPPSIPILAGERPGPAGGYC